MKKMQKLFFFLFSFLILVPSLVSAAVTPSGFSIRDTENAVLTLQNESLFDTVSFFLNWLLGFVGIFGVTAFVISGVLYLTSVGDEEKAKKAKSIMTYAIIGLVVALIGLIVVNAVAGLTGAGDPYESITY